MLCRRPVRSSEAVPTDRRPPSRDEPLDRGVTCSICGARAPWAGNPYRPFCSQICRLIDLGRWLDERYRIDEREGSDEGPEGSARGPEESENNDVR
jgi:endogenous inhibitor of DNA gyrase (YacG/DUF329 family)